MPQKKAAQQRKKISVEDRRKEAFRLWTSDDELSLREVGKRLGISHEQARNDLKAYLETRDNERAEDVESWKRKQLARLNRKLVRLEAIATGEALKGKKIVASRKLEIQIKAEMQSMHVLREINEITGVRAAVKVDIAPIQMMHTMSAIDLSKLTDDELADYEKLLSKANAA